MVAKLSPAAPAAAADRLAVTWVAAAFALAVGSLMAYWPWGFGAPAFRFIYTHIDAMGAAFLASGATLAAAAIYPSWPPLIERFARLLFLVAITIYWWNVAVLGAGPTGIIVYPPMAFCVALEAFRQRPVRHTFSLFVASVALGFGTYMAVRPAAFAGSIYGRFIEQLGLFSIAYLVAGALLAVGAFKSRAAERWGAALASGLFFHVAMLGLAQRAWAGSALYVVLGVFSALHASEVRLVSTTTLRFRLLRAVVIAGVLPLLLLGAIASAIGQKALVAQVRNNAQQAAEAEATWLTERLRTARSVLNVVASTEELQQWALWRERHALSYRLRQLADAAGIDGLWLLGEMGEQIASSHGVVDESRRYDDREYFRLAPAAPGVFVSRPLVGNAGKPMIVLSTRVAGPHSGVIGGAMLLSTLSKHSTATSQAYEVQVIDVRDRNLVRAPTVAERLEHSTIAAAQTAKVGEPSFDAAGAPLLLSVADVPGTPWQVIVTARLREAYAPLATLSVAVVGVALLAALLAILLATIGAREILARIERLRASFSRFSSSSSPSPVAPQSDELAQLEAGFYRLAADIERTQDELKAAIATREQFLSIASHELRTPLTSLTLAVDQLARAKEGARLSPAGVARMQRQVLRLTRLVSDLLDATRLSTGKFTLEISSSDVVALVVETVDRLRQVHPDRAAGLSLAVPTTPVTTQCDPYRIEQLVTNYIENAFRYSPEGSPVRVVLEQHAGLLTLSVKDEGIGISPEHLEHIFTPFSRAPNASSMYAGGLGLGLAIASEIATRHAGRVWAESAGAGRGSTFFVELPLVETPALKPTDEKHQGTTQVETPPIAWPMPPNSTETA